MVKEGRNQGERFKKKKSIPIGGEKNGLRVTIFLSRLNDTKIVLSLRPVTEGKAGVDRSTLTGGGGDGR